MFSTCTILCEKTSFVMVETAVSVYFPISLVQVAFASRSLYVNLMIIDRSSSSVAGMALG